ncbi:MAG: TonB-dependent receptor [Burkholderiales bacterium]|nr:TonB-dependent receptor [Burkholderiales bacterium]
MPPHSRLRPASLALVLSLLFPPAIPTAWSQATLPAATQTSVPIDIPGQPLAQALNQWAQQTRLEFIVDPALVAGKSAPAVSGSMTPQQALERLLAGSGLEATVDGSTMVIKPPPPATGSEQELTEVKVVSEVEVHARYQSASHELPPEYAGGQVARGGRLGVLGNIDVMDAPFNITSYTDKVITDQQARSLSDVLLNDPSVRSVFPKDSGIDQIYVRGFLSANEDVAYNGLFGIASSASNVLAVEGFERVEILKGASALLYGMNLGGTTGGIINLVPKRAGDIDITRFTASYLSDSTLGGHVDIGRRFGADRMLGVRINGLYRNGDAAIDRYEQETQFVTIGFDARGDRARGSLDLGYQSQHHEDITRGIRLAANVAVPKPPEPGSNYSQPWTFGDNDNFFGMARGEFDLHSTTTAFASIGFNQLRNEFLASFPTLTNASTGAMNETAPFHSRTFTDTWSGELGLRGQFETGTFTHRPVLSGNHIHQKTGLAREAFGLLASNLYDPIFHPKPTLTDFPSKPPKTGETELSSIVLADTIGVLEDQVQLTIGARYQIILVDSFNATTGVRTAHYNDSAVTPAVGLVVKPITNLSLYVNYIEALSQGPTAPLSATNAGEIFAPFKSKQYEIGAKYDLGRFALTASLFQISRPSGATDPATNTFSLIGEQRNRGVELSIFGEPLAHLRVLGGLTLLDGELTKTAGGVTDGNTAPGVPRVQLNLGAEWDLPGLRGLTLTGRIVHTSKQYFDPTNARSIPDWTRLDLGARYVFNAPTPVTIRFNVENVADKAYWASAVGTFGTGELSAGGLRTYLLSATVDF